MKAITRIPVFTIDEDGEQIALVPLANTTKHAKLNTEDYRRLINGGLSPLWTLNDAGFTSKDGERIAYVRCAANRQGRLETIARLIVRAREGQAVRYRDGDTLNLRRHNLVLVQYRRRNRRHMQQQQQMQQQRMKQQGVHLR